MMLEIFVYTVVVFMALSYVVSTILAIGAALYPLPGPPRMRDFGEELFANMLVFNALSPIVTVCFLCSFRYWVEEWFRVRAEYKRYDATIGQDIKFLRSILPIRRPGDKNGEFE